MKINGLKLHYELNGAQGNPLVIIHGYMGAIADWRSFLNEFSQQFRVLMLDNRGHGKSAAPEPQEHYNVEYLASDIMALVARQSFRSFHLVGHSIGGAVAQEIALLQPERILTLTLAATTNSFNEHEVDRPPYIPPERQLVVAKRRQTMSPFAQAGGWAALDAWQGTTGRAGRIEAPTLIIYGERDASAIVAGSRRLKELIPHAEVVVIPEAGHSPHFEKPQRFNAAVGDFIRRHNPAE